MTTEQQAEPGTSSAEPGRTDERPEWAEDLKDEILGTVRDMLGQARGRERSHLTEPGQGRADRAERGVADLDKMIADAIAVNDKARQEEADRKRTGERLDQLEAAAPERQPVERGPLHRLMKWGDPPD